MKNTAISYEYRDGSNTKTAKTIVLQGSLTEGRITDVMKATLGDDDKSWIIPGQVGLPDLQDSFASLSVWREELDHPWHSILLIEPTDADLTPGIEMSAMTLASALETAKWDEAWEPACRPLMDLRLQGILDENEGRLHSVTNGVTPAGIYYTLGVPTLAASVTQHPEDSDLFCISYGKSHQSPKGISPSLAAMGYEFVEPDAVRDASSMISDPIFGLDALKIMAEASILTNGIQGETAEVTGADLAAAGKTMAEHIAKLLDIEIAQPENTNEAPGF